MLLLLKSLQYANTCDVLKALLQLFHLDHIVLHLHCLLANSLCSPVKRLDILVVQLHCNVAIRNHRVKVIQLVVGGGSVLMEGGQVYLLVRGTFFYCFCVAFNCQLVPSPSKVFVSSVFGSNSLFKRVGGTFRDIFYLNLLLGFGNWCWGWLFLRNFFYFLYFFFCLFALLLLPTILLCV